MGATGPCAGMCSNPVVVPPNTNSGELGTAATCHVVMGRTGGLVCGNFVAPRTFTVNGTSFNCTAGGGGNLPAAVAGGWCFEASAGNNSYAYFATYNVVP
jgi:hypothetical protein